jgi:hypothetical protein
MDAFEYKSVSNEVANQNSAFAKRMNTANDDLNLTKDLLKAYKEKESAKMSHFYTLGALMLAHANLVIVCHEDDDCERYIEKLYT